MFETSNAFWLFSGVFAGILTGLIPSLNMAMPLMLVLPFADSMSVMDIFLFWAAVIVGSQYFGSVAVLGTNIPGETSSLVYADKIKSLGVADRLKLIRSTALGSTIASVSASLVCIWLIFFSSVDNLFFLNRVSVKAVIFTAVILLFIIPSKHKISTGALLLVGATLGIKYNYSLPVFFYPVQEFSLHITFFMVMIGVMLVPDLFLKNKDFSVIPDTPSEFSNQLPWLSMFKGSAIGGILGLVPGPNATIASTVAFTSEKKLYNKVTSAESANNAAMITGMMPLLLVGIPLTLTEVIVLQMLEVKLIQWPAIENMSALGQMVLYVQLVCVVLALLYAFLSTRFLDVYRRILLLINKTGSAIMLLVLVVLSTVDWHTSDLSIIIYSLGLMLFSAIGIVLKKFKIDSTPLLFGLLLGDQMVWTFGQLISFIT